MPEYMTGIVTWLDGSSPLVRFPFVILLFLFFLLFHETTRNISRRVSVKISREKRYALKIQSQEIVSARA